MVDVDVGDTEIAVMCDIARSEGLDLNVDKQRVLDRLIAGGLVEPSESDASAQNNVLKRNTFALTRKGQHLLDDRGVGVNES